MRGQYIRLQCVPSCRPVCSVLQCVFAVCCCLQCVAVYSLASCAFLSPCCSVWCSACCSVCCSVCCSACCSARCLAPAVALSFVWYGKRGACSGAENWAVTGTVSYAAGTASWTSSANSIAFAFSNRQQRSPSVSLTSTLCSCKKPTISSRRLLPPHDRLSQPVRSKPTASNILRGVQDTECEFFSEFRDSKNAKSAIMCKECYNHLDCLAHSITAPATAAVYAQPERFRSGSHFN